MQDSRETVGSIRLESKLPSTSHQVPTLLTERPQISTQTYILENENLPSNSSEGQPIKAGGQLQSARQIVPTTSNPGSAHVAKSMAGISDRPTVLIKDSLRGGGQGYKTSSNLKSVEIGGPAASASLTD